MIYPFCSQYTMVLLTGSLRSNLYLVKQAPSLPSKHLRCWSWLINFGHERYKAIQNKIEIKTSSTEKGAVCYLKSSEIGLLQGTLTEGEGSLFRNKLK